MTYDIIRPGEWCSWLPRLSRDRMAERLARRNSAEPFRRSPVRRCRQGRLRRPQEEVVADGANRRRLARPAVLAQGEHRFDECAMRACKPRDAELAKLTSRFDDLRLIGRVPVKPPDDGG